MSPDWSAKIEPVPYAKMDDPQSLNLYSYMLNNPFAGVDPDGHWGEAWCVGSGASSLACHVATAWNQEHGIASNSAQQQSAGQQGTNNKLKYKTVSGGQGSNPWEIKWSLTHNSKKGGFIVQHIVADFGQDHFDYYEAWPVAAGSHVPSIQGTDSNGNSYSDMFAGPTGSHIHATANFYEGLTLPSSFKVQPEGFPAGILPAATSNPNLPTQNATPANTRWWMAY